MDRRVEAHQVTLARHDRQLAVRLLCPVLGSLHRRPFPSDLPRCELAAAVATTQNGTDPARHDHASIMR